MAQKNTDVSGKEPEETTAATDAAPAGKNRPLKTLRIGECSASIWSRTIEVRGEQRVLYSVSLEQSYVDKTGKRRYTGFFDLNALGTVVMLCVQAAESIRELDEHQSQAEDSAE